MMCATDEPEWQESGSYGASILQEAPYVDLLIVRSARLPASMTESRRGFQLNVNATVLRSCSFHQDHWAWRLEPYVPVSFARMQEHPLPTETALTIPCPHCMAGITCRPMIAHKDGRFVCRDCAHTVRLGVPEYRCTCRPCLTLSRKPLLTDHTSHPLPQ
jgi:hypothetical protein